MDFLPEALEAYIHAHTSSQSGLLARIARETAAQVMLPRMISGHLQGRFLALISQLIQPLRVLEIGTFTGYSAICLAEGLPPNGRLYTIDVNDELETRVRGYFEQSAKANQIEYLLGQANIVLPTLKEHIWDLVFIDADKKNYTLYYQMIIDQVRPGGLIIADNVLWSGKVVGQTGKNPDKDTQAILDFNLMAVNDERTEQLLLPLRDGLMLMRKK